MAKKIKVIVADDHELLRKGCISLLKKDAGISVVGEAGNGRQVLDLLKSDVADIVLLDLEMPVMGGEEALEKIKSLYPAIKIIIVSAYYNETLVTEYISRGANSYLHKNIKPDKLIDAIYSVHEKGQYFDYYIANSMLNGLKKEKKVSSPLNELSDREKEVLILVCKNYTNKEIAERIHLSARTIAFHRKNITTKTNCKRTAQLVLFAINNGLINTELDKFIPNISL